MKIRFTTAASNEGVFTIDGVDYHGPIPPQAGDIRARYDDLLPFAEIVPYAPPAPAQIKSVTAAQAVIALEHTGILDAVETLMPSYPRSVQLWYARAQEWQRYNPYVMGIGLELGLADADIDQLFAYASTL